MEHRQIKALEECVLAFARVRDQRMRLTAEESALKASARYLLHKHGKTAYRRDGIEIALVPGEETVRVHVAKGAAAHESDTPPITTEQRAIVDALKASYADESGPD